MRLNVPRAKPLPGKQGQNKTLPLNQMANLNQTKPKRTKLKQTEPNPFAIPCPCGLTDQGPQLTQASPLSRVSPSATQNFWDCLQTSYSRVFRSFPLMTQLMAFQNLFIVNFENENFKNQCAFANTSTQTHINISLIPPTNHYWKCVAKTFVLRPTTKTSSTRTCYEIALLRNCFIVLLFRFSCPLHNIPKDIHQWIGCQVNTFVFIKDTNYCNKLKYWADKLKSTHATLRWTYACVDEWI